jgi:hypothetical protein
MATGIRAARAAKLIERYERGDYEAIRFIRVADEVHVLALTEDRPARHKRLFGDSEAEQFMRFALGECWSVCAKKFVRHRGGFESGAQLVSHFPDELLCYECHKAFGLEQGHLIFEVNQDDGRAADQLGRMDDDLVSKGRPPLR